MKENSRDIEELERCEKDREIHLLREAVKKLEQENKELKEYKRIAELTKISCCTAQNCEALNNAIREGIENEELKEENERLKQDGKIIREMAKYIAEHTTISIDNYGASVEEWERYFRKKCE